MNQPQIRSSQMITTFGPGAMVDLPNHSIIVAGLEDWRYDFVKGRIHGIVKEPRLSAKLAHLLPEIKGMSVELRTPPAETISQKGSRKPGVVGYIFPHWFIVRNPKFSEGYRRRRLVDREQLSKGRFRENGRRYSVVPVRFVRACRKGHVGDIQWRQYAHGNLTDCRQSLWMEERGTTGDISDVWIICDCGANRSMSDAAEPNTLGQCNGSRPWLNDRDDCDEPNRLLLRTASNAYFPLILSMISIPKMVSEIEAAVREHWESFENIRSIDDLKSFRGFMPNSIARKVAGFSDDEVFSVIEKLRQNSHLTIDESPKKGEFDALKNVPKAIENDVPDGDFFARKLDSKSWRDPKFNSLIAKIVLVHRLREVMALVGFTRFEPQSADFIGELDIAVERAPIAKNPNWMPVAENRGEGIFIEFKTEAIESWQQKTAVLNREVEFRSSLNSWQQKHPELAQRALMPSMPYLMLHSLSHLLICAISLECGYPMASLRERIYAFGPTIETNARYGILLFTASTGSEGTLGGLANSASNLRRHLFRALELGVMCSNDPVCSSKSTLGENDRICGHACHSCLHIAETSCEQFNQYLDRTLVVPTIERRGAEFFSI